MIRRAATNRVLNVLRHWVSKHSQVGGSLLCALQEACRHRSRSQLLPGDCWLSELMASWGSRREEAQVPRQYSRRTLTVP